MSRGRTLAALLGCGILLSTTALWLPGGAHATRHFRRTDPSTLIAFSLGLRTNQTGLERFLRAARDPHSALYGRTLTPAAIGARFGLPLAEVAHVKSLLAARHVAVTATYPQRMTLDARASVATLERLFHVQFHDLPGSDGRLYPAPTASPPRVPRAMRPWVDSVVGLDTRPRAVPSLLFPLAPQDASRAYDLAALRNHGITGQGQTIAVISFQDFDMSDFRLFKGTFGVHGPNPQRVKLSAVSDSGVDEANLDVQVIRGAAPEAKIIVYEAQNDSAGELAMLNRFVSGPAAIGSYSWGFCDDQLPASDKYRRLMNEVLAAAAAAGKTLFVATGDEGAYECQNLHFYDHRLTVSFPADNPHVVAVGGTLLGLTSKGSYLGEDAWVEPLSDAGGGGGVDPVDRKPSWQKRFVPGGHRGIPDVSAAASTGSPWLTAVDGQILSIGGTSAATPFWAASMLLAEGYARTQRVDARCFLTPLLYRVYSMKPQPYFPAFHDIQSGTNRYYAAKRGWDYATGLGSPDVWNLARDLTAYLRAHPGACRSS